MTATPPSRSTTLTGRHVRLEPLAHSHVPDLFQAVRGDEEVWRWVSALMPHTEEEMHAVIDARLDNPDRVPFAVIQLATGRCVGVTCYADISARDESLEIGGTFYGRAVWRTAVNTEAKLLLLTHAFEELGMGRVQWCADRRNERSRTAILRLGATYEGTFRRDRRRPDGTWRDTVQFAMLREEWPAAKERLTERLLRG
ncbi:GNAT family N-acetyltransferase [Streptomyces sp. NPDC052396]|uniref:GNAT family N-acetyltransferase n=1 Tax=Streptomyces sp. NPDC052396 TaxID=3365689 RepID=UPI0037D1F932